MNRSLVSLHAKYQAKSQIDPNRKSNSSWNIRPMPDHRPIHDSSQKLTTKSSSKTSTKPITKPSTKPSQKLNAEPKYRPDKILYVAKSN